MSITWSSIEHLIIYIIEIRWHYYDKFACKIFRYLYDEGLIKNKSERGNWKLCEKLGLFEILQ